MTPSVPHQQPSVSALVLRSLLVRLAFAGALVVASLSLRAAEAPAGAPPAPKVTVAAVEEKLLADYEEITGHVDAIETVDLRARVSGHLDAVHFQAGQIVKKGDLLFTIDPRWYQAQFDLAAARAAVAEREAKRADDLLAGAAISSEEGEARKARAAEARAALVIAQLDLEHTQVRSPITGRVGRALITPGNLVAGSPGNATLLTSIVTTGEAYVYADIDEATYLKFSRLARENNLVTEGTRVPVDLQLADENGFPRHGFIESTDNRMNANTGSLTLRMIFPNTDRALVPGLYARVRVPVSAPQRTLLISERAIGTDQSQKFVLSVAKDNVTSYRSVKLGGSVDGKRIVRSGLQPGDQVIVNGLQRVRPGMTVQPEIAATAVTSIAPVAPTPAGTAVATAH